MPMSASDYLNAADSQSDMAMKASGPERESLHLAAAQVAAIQAVAAAIDRLAAAIEGTGGRP
jgi:hypothetical protein